MKTLGLAALPLLALGGSWPAVATEIEMKIDVAGIERTVVITLDEEIAPKTSANFAKHCEEGYYDGVGFHRVIPNYIVQGGDPLTKDPEAKAKWGTGGPDFKIPAELGGKHLRGAIAAARLGDKVNPTKESSGSQFYVVLRDVAPLDGEYTVFGTVTSGLEVFDEISGAPSNERNVPEASITIVSTKVLEATESTTPEPSPDLTSTETMPAETGSGAAIAAVTVPDSTTEPDPIPIPIPAPDPTLAATEPIPGIKMASETPAPLSTEPDPLSTTPPASVDTRYQLAGEETMPVNVDRGMPSMPRLEADSDKLIEAAKALTGREDGFVPVSSVGTSTTPGGGQASAPALTPAPAPPAPEPTPAPAPAPAPAPVSSEPIAAVPSDPGVPAAPTEEPLPTEPASAFDDGFTSPEPGIPTTKKNGKPIGPVGRFIRRVW